MASTWCPSTRTLGTARERTSSQKSPFLLLHKQQILNPFVSTNALSLHLCTLMLSFSFPSVPLSYKGPSAALACFLLEMFACFYGFSNLFLKLLLPSLYQQLAFVWPECMLCLIFVLCSILPVFKGLLFAMCDFFVPAIYFTTLVVLADTQEISWLDQLKKFAM